MNSFDMQLYLNSVDFSIHYKPLQIFGKTRKINIRFGVEPWNLKFLSSIYGNAEFYLEVTNFRKY